MDNLNLAEMIKNGLVICRTKRAAHPFGIFYGENPLEYGFPLLMLEVSLLIAVSRTIRFLLKPLRQPKIVSEIIGGIILGPSVLSRNTKFREYMFPDNASYIVRNLGIMGFMYFLFISGVKMDLLVVKRVEKKQWYIACIGVLVPLVCSTIVAVIQRNSFEIKELQKVSSIFGISASLAITSFPVLYPVVKELNLLSSGIGRMALSTSIVSDVVGVAGIVIFEASKQAEKSVLSAVWFTISFIGVGVSIIGGIRQAMMWIVRTTPEGKQVDQIYIVAILLGVMIAAFITDMFGLAICNGSFWLGLAVPDGPPLGATLVEKTESFAMDFLMPFSFMYIGMIVDLHSLGGNWSTLKPLFNMIVVGYVTKIVATVATSRFFDLSMRDSLTVSLIMSLRGEVELVLFMHWMDFKMIGIPEFTILVLILVIATACITPIINVLYDPMRPYMVTKRRNIQHHPPNSELQLVVCIHGEDDLSGLMKLLEVSNPTHNSPFEVYALCLVELIGRANPEFIDHEEKEKGSNHSNSSAIYNALKIFQEARSECMKLHCYTTMTDTRSMHQDICELALSKKASLIILPYCKKNLANTIKVRGRKKGSQSVNSNVLAHAPCSVGILVDKSPYENLARGALRSSTYHLIVLFLGGADAREALTYADRMAANPNITMTVVRFLPHDNEEENAMEKKLDDGLVTWFWVKNEANNRIIYREVMVKNGEETAAAIHAMNDNCYDLWIVGRKNGINPVLLQGLSNWSYNNELGVIGDFVASVDFGSSASVLSVHQQVLRGQDSVSDGILARFFPFII